MKLDNCYSDLNTMVVYYWWDGVWCYPNELEEYLSYKSYDYNCFYCVEGTTEEEIELFINKLTQTYED